MQNKANPFDFAPKGQAQDMLHPKGVEQGSDPIQSSIVNRQ
jgi:hypothetical protein